jgi:uncharacterized small protein (DUF1192 family)
LFLKTEAEEGKDTKGTNETEERIQLLSASILRTGAYLASSFAIQSMHAQRKTAL